MTNTQGTNFCKLLRDMLGVVHPLPLKDCANTQRIWSKATHMAQIPCLETLFTRAGTSSCIPVKAMLEGAEVGVQMMNGLGAKATN